MIFFRGLVQTGNHIVMGGGITAEIRVLIQISYMGARLDKSFAVIGFDHATDHFHQGGFAGPIAAHQTDPVALTNIQFHTVEKGRWPITQGNVFEGQKGWRQFENPVNYSLIGTHYCEMLCNAI